tara:strand:+ start:183 stop:512 length:330 start_codon:yes stop_codon:yes gene_type:complete
MIVLSTSFEIAGYDIIEHITVVRGNCSRKKFTFKNFFVIFQTLFDSEITDFSNMMIENRSIAEKRMIQKAIHLEADAIIGVRFINSVAVAGSIESMVYGTAVKLRKKEP